MRQERVINWSWAPAGTVTSAVLLRSAIQVWCGIEAVPPGGINLIALLVGR